MNKKFARCIQSGLMPSMPVTWLVCSHWSRRMSFFSPDPAKRRSAEGGSSNFTTAHQQMRICLHQRVGRGHCCRRGRLHAKPGRTVSDPTRWREDGTVRRASHDGISQTARRSLASVPRCPHFVRRGLTLRWSQRRGCDWKRGSQNGKIGLVSLSPPERGEGRGEGHFASRSNGVEYPISQRPVPIEADPHFQWHPNADCALSLWMV